MKKNLKMKLSRAAMTLLLLLVNSTIMWADDNQFVISYMHDPQFDTESYGTYKHTRCEPVELWEAPSKEGYTFLHWFGYWTKQDGSQAFNNFPAEATLGTDITCNISYSYPFMTLQAVFTANSYTLTFDANGRRPNQRCPSVRAELRRQGDGNLRRYASK